MTGSKSKRRDLRLEMRVKNNILWRAIHDLHPTVAAFCRAHNLQQTEVGELISFKVSPFTKRGEYRVAAVRLSEVLGIATTELFPPKLYANMLEIGSFNAVEVSSFAALPNTARKEIRLLPAPAEQSPDVLYAETELHKKKSATLKEALKELSFREQKILEMRFGLGEDRSTYTLDEVAKVFKLNRERIRQIEAKAIRRLRQPGLSGILAKLL